MANRKRRNDEYNYQNINIKTIEDNKKIRVAKIATRSHSRSLVYYIYTVIYVYVMYEYVLYICMYTC